MKTIVIDPGHGGSDPGGVAFGRQEKNDNLRLSLLIADKLRSYGQNVVMTRSTDVFVPLLDRSYISNANNADLFVSMHRDWFDDPDVMGVTALVSPGASAKSYEAAEKLLDSVAGVGINKNRGIREQNVSVLRNTYAPAVLMEMGFITHQGDNALFDEKFNAYADALARSIMLTLGETIPTQPPSAADPVIKSIQQTLNSRYNTGLAVDGITGPNTRRALVKGLQTELNRSYGAGITVDGVFGPRTKAVIPLIRSGAKNNIVYLMQAALYLKGFKTIPDGIFGPNTETQLRAFQSANGLSPDGVAGPATFEKLFA